MIKSILLEKWNSKTSECLLYGKQVEIRKSGNEILPQSAHNTVFPTRWRSPSRGTGSAAQDKGIRRCFSALTNTWGPTSWASSGHNSGFMVGGKASLSIWIDVQSGVQNHWTQGTTRTNDSGMEETKQTAGVGQHNLPYSVRALNQTEETTQRSEMTVHCLRAPIARWTSRRCFFFLQSRCL